MSHQLQSFLSLRSVSRPRRANRSRRPLALELLEDRVVPAAISLSDLTIDPTAYDSSAILVRLRAGVTDPASLRILNDTQFGDALSLVPGLWEVRLAPGISVQSALAAYSSNPFVLSATPNYRLTIQQIPNDPQFGSLWGLHNTGQNSGTVDADIDAPEAWDVSTGSATSPVIVAIIDTGVDYTHPDLAANMWINAGEVAGDGVDNDGNGFVDDVRGYDFNNNDADPMDDNGHGTHVAGTIGAVGNNGIGVAGIAWNVRIMPVKVFDASGNGFLDTAIRGLNYAVQMGASISNNSYGATGAGADDPLFLEAIHNAANFGHIFVAAAGNAGTDNDAAGFFPGGFDVDNILSVAATDRNDQLAYFSNFGATTVDLAAPGVDILSTQPGGKYQTLSGTSMATPHVTGVVALVRGLHPDWTYHQVIDQVLGSVDYLPSLDGRVATAGRLNAARALLDVDGPRVVASTPAGGVGGVVGSVRLFFNEPVDPAGFTADDIASFTGPNGSIGITGVNPVAASFNRKFDITFAPQIARGGYAMVLGPAITDRLGNAMDQDADGILGEVPDDRYTASFVINDQYVFNSTDTPKSLVPFGTTSSYLTVDQDLSIADLDVRINVSSGDVSLLGISLVSPTGKAVSLSPVTGADMGSEFRNTTFDDEATGSLDGGAPPFTGSYLPVSPLSAVDGQSTLGAWHLDVLNLFGGTINSWSLMVVANAPRLSIADVSIAEGDAGTSQATFTVRLSNAIDQPVTVDYATGGGAATPGDDYQSASGTLTFNPGELVKSFTVTINGDTIDEPDETFLVDLSGAVNATISDGEAVGAIRNDEVEVSIGDATVLETNSGTVNATFTVSLAAPSSHSVTVNYATAAGTATAGTDYVTGSGSLTFAAGEVTKTIVVGVKGDTRYEQAETYFVNLTVVDGLLVDGQGQGTISNDDPAPLISVGDVALTEGASGTKNMSFSVTLSNTSDDTVTVDYTTVNGTATANDDYTPQSGTLTFAPGQSLKSVLIAIAGDAIVEPTETFFVNLSNPTKALMFDNQALGSILGDEASVTVDDLTVSEGDSGAFPVGFAVRLSTPATFEVSVAYTTAAGSAASGGDFIAASGVLTFAPGETVKTVSTIGLADTLDEADEYFTLNLSSPINGAIADTQGRATILDDDAAPTLSIFDAFLAEGNSGTKNMGFTVKLSAPSGQTVTVNYASADGAALAASDYQARAGTLSFNPGVTSMAVNIPLNGDADAEIDESLFVNLSDAAHAAIDDGQAIGTIQDDDSLIVNDVAVLEGADGTTTTAVFTVSLLAARTEAVTVNYATAANTAAAGVDFLSTAGTLTFLPGETAKTVSVAVAGDRFNEPDEALFLNLSNAVGALIGDSQGKATIGNDDAVPSLSIADVFQIEGNSGLRYVSFVLTLSEVSGQNIVVNYSTADGTASSASDYSARSGTATIYAGSTSLTMSITVTVDTVAEGTELFYFNMTSATNAILTDDQAIGTIYDDDPLPVLSINDVTLTEGQSGIKTAIFTVTLSAASTQTATVLVSTSDGSANAGVDYVGKSELVTFAPGQTSKNVTVTINGDTTLEASETFFATLSSATSATLGDASGLATLTNDDSSLRIDDVTLAEGNDGATMAVFTVTLTGALPNDAVRVNYSTANGTAVSAADFVWTTGTLILAAGQSTAQIAVPVVGDLINENSETFFVNLSGAVNAAVSDSQGMATITDAADPIPVLSVADAAISEGNSGTRNLIFTVKLSAASGKTVTVNYATADGSAVAGGDYQVRSGVLIFSPGTTSQTVTVPLTVDTVGETDETFSLNLSNAANATIADAQAIGTIQDDDSLVIDDVSITEGDNGASVAHFTVRLLAARDFDVSVNFATANSTAVSGSDYIAASGTLAFAPGETAKAVDVIVPADRLNEGAEMFFVNLSNAIGTLIADSQGIATILNDDPIPSLSIANVSIIEGNSGTKSLTFAVRLSEPSGQTVSVGYATADGSAIAASGDYVARNGTLTLSPGQQSISLLVTVNGDMTIEGNEFFLINLSNPVLATLATTQATGAIFDDDSLGLGGSSLRGSPGTPAVPAPVPQTKNGTLAARIDRGAATLPPFWATTFFNSDRSASIFASYLNATTADERPQEWRVKNRSNSKSQPGSSAGRVPTENPIR
jgi:subtilisin family serine protease/subtilisin-like proprotein convertase family protein/DNA-binding cell septation regulator SpoVG